VEVAHLRSSVPTYPLQVKINFIKNNNDAYNFSNFKDEFTLSKGNANRFKCFFLLILLYFIVFYGIIESKVDCIRCEQYRPAIRQSLNFAGAKFFSNFLSLLKKFTQITQM